MASESILPKLSMAQDSSRSSVSETSITKAEELHQTNSSRSKLFAILSEKISLEANGVAPLTLEQRTDAHFLQNFTLWMTMNATIACFSTGTLGPLLYSLSLKDSFLVIIFFNIFSCGVPAMMAIAGPKLGMRTMGIARYSYGYFGAIVPAFLNLVTFIGFCSVNAIVGGQTLSAINQDNLSVTVGIVIIAIVSMLISFAGYKTLHLLEKWAWIPVLSSFIILIGIGGKHLSTSMDFESIPATAGSVLSFAAIIVGFSISWSGCSSDFCTYMVPTISSTKVFVYTFFGLYLPSMLLQLIGAAFSAAALSGDVMEWTDAFNNYSTGGLLGAILSPLGGFGKFILVILGLGMICNNAPTIYAFSLSSQIVFPFLARFPRWIFPVIGTIIYLPIAIVGASNFAAVLNNFLGILGYWTSIFASILFVEHFAFRGGRFSSYNIEDWDSRANLPSGIPALFSSAVGAAGVVLAMDQVWFRGPIAIAIAGPDAEFGGDLAFELGMIMSAISYGATRFIEKKFFGGK